MFGAAIAYVVFVFTAERDARLRQHDFHADNLDYCAIFHFPASAARLSELAGILSVAWIALYPLCGCDPGEEITTQTCFRTCIQRVADMSDFGNRCLRYCDQGADESGNDTRNLHGFCHGKLESVAAFVERYFNRPMKQIVKALTGK